MPKVIAKNSDVPKDFAALVIEGYHNQVKDNDRPTGQVMMELGQVVKLYGGRKEIDPEILKECAKNVVDNFGYISLAEIREAYRQLANGEIEVRGAEMYGGEFNAAQVGKILGAYSERRKSVLAAYLREREEEKEREAREEKARIMQDAFDNEFPEMIKNARETITDWRDVPAFWYDAANSRGMLTWVKGEAIRLFADAQELEKIEQANEMDALSIGDIFRQKEKDPIERAKVIARKLTVFRKLIKS